MRTLVLAALLTLGVPTTAFAAEEATDPPTARHWYGGPILAADAAAATMILLASRLDSMGTQGALGGVGLISYALMPGALHAAHGNWTKGFGSLGLRVALPPAAAFLAMSAAGNGDCHSDDDSCAVAAFATGFFVGMGAAALFDQWLAFDHHPVPGTRKLLVSPTVGVSRAGTTLGLAGIF